MVIHEMSRKECLRLLAEAKLVRLGCANENQPYVVPVHLAYDEKFECFYGFTTPGQKVDWMRANPLVCVEMEDIEADDQWVSVIASGRYEELPEGPEPGAPQRAGETWSASADSFHRLDDEEGCDAERERAWQLLKSRHAVWWEAGCSAWANRVHGDSAEPLIFLYYKIRFDRVTGYRATRGPLPTPEPLPPVPWGDWLRKALLRVLGGA